MSNIDRNEFRDRLIRISGADDGIADTIMCKTKPFFDYADNGTYRFETMAGLDRIAMAQALGSALNMQVSPQDLLPVSVSEPWINSPEFLDDSIIKVTLHALIRNGMANRFYPTMQNLHSKQLKQAMLGSSMTVLELESLLQDTLQRPLWKSIEACVQVERVWPDDLWRELFLCINCCLIHYIGYLVANMDAEAARLEPLIHQLPLAVPLGTKIYASRRMLVFVA